jgi:hypothetical protein
MPQMRPAEATANFIELMMPHRTQISFHPHSQTVEFRVFPSIPGPTLRVSKASAQMLCDQRRAKNAAAHLHWQIKSHARQALTTSASAA